MFRRSSAWYWLSLFILAGLAALYVQQRDVRGRYQRFLEGEQQVQRLRGEVQDLEQSRHRLGRSVSNLRSDPVEWEAAIRRNQGLVRQGEKVYRIEAAP